MTPLPKLEAALVAVGESMAAHEWATCAMLDAVLQGARIVPAALWSAMDAGAGEA